MHYFQFNIGDYASHTRHLSPMEDLAYRRLLDLYYLKDGEVYGDEAEVARQIGLRDHVLEVTQVLQDFFCIGEDDRWTHDRCDAEIAHFREKSEKASNAGKASAQRRLNKRSTNVQPTNNQEPITNNQQPVSSSKEDVSSDDDAPVRPQEIIDAWNSMAKRAGLSEIKMLNPKRAASLKSRIKECPDVETWSTALQNIERSKFLRGENDRGWKANFDFLLQPSSFTKLIEGSYQ
jgi:uncharacterized protein YdaU (DUF1376 family)